MEIEAIPKRVVVAGDWHGNSRWAEHVISRAGDLLRDEARPLVLQLGDFGVWPGPVGAGYISRVREACTRAGVQLWFIDGNHEDFTQIQEHRDGYPVRWLPRGSRWNWHGRTWLALGGAVSVDRALRTEGLSWWPEEEITADQALDVIKAGPADVMLTHDCPTGVTITFPPPPAAWDLADLARSDRHRERLQIVAGAVQPRYLVHGHLHMAYQRTCDLGYGPVEVTGLDCDGGAGPNFAVLDTEQMEWSAGV